ncbi:MAG: mobile mystery protein B [Deltaproteobacteria bacterium]|nr:mobile mystery protein B [Deltaproteobacteria bacterium]
MREPPHRPDGATALSPEELEGIRHPHVATRAQLDELEQANVQQGLLWLRRQERTDLLTEQFVRQLHEKLFGEVWCWAGAFRRTGKNVGVEACMIAIELRKLLDDTRTWIECHTFPPKELAARFHHRLVAIHPFPNGNGRHSRIMADAILMHILGEPGIDWIGGQDLLRPNDRRMRYIEALRNADQGDFTALLLFVGADSRA